MNFSIESVAREYIYSHFSSASVAEKEKIVLDWANKVSVAKNIVADFSARAGDVGDKKILDAGCGNGGLSIALALAGARPIGLEIEKDLYDISNKHAEFYGVDIGAVLYDGIIMPFDDSLFDAAISVSVLEHTSDPASYLKEILRTVKPGGDLYLAFPNKFWLKETHTGILLLTYIPKFFQPRLIRLLHRGTLDNYNLHFYSFSDLEKMISTMVYDGYRWKIVAETGNSSNKYKILIKKTLQFLGISYKTFLPHISVILKKVD